MPLNDPFFDDLEASACYGDGAIEPSQILIPQIDADALDEYTRDLRRAGKTSARTETTSSPTEAAQ